MVDVSGKAETVRTARAGGTIEMAEATLAAIRENRLAKGDVIAVARVAGIQAVKRTSDLIPLCHPLPVTDVQVEVVEDQGLPGMRVEVTVRTVGRTGVEMEALTGVSVTLLTLFDMVKGLDSALLLSNISVLSKTGGKTSSHNDSDHGTS
jgi:cyclic pyranopterin phosphate synthase